VLLMGCECGYNPSSPTASKPMLMIEWDAVIRLSIPARNSTHHMKIRTSNPSAATRPYCSNHVTRKERKPQCIQNPPHSATKTSTAPSPTFQTPSTPKNYRTQSTPRIQSRGYERYHLCITTTAERHRGRYDQTRLIPQTQNHPHVPSARSYPGLRHTESESSWQK
jgi:hypothetical protein